MSFIIYATSRFTRLGVSVVRIYHDSDVEHKHGGLERADQAHIRGLAHHLGLGAEYFK
jgi:hypothetical protein